MNNKNNKLTEHQNKYEQIITHSMHFFIYWGRAQLACVLIHPWQIS